MFAGLSALIPCLPFLAGGILLVLAWGEAPGKRPGSGKKAFLAIFATGLSFLLGVVVLVRVVYAGPVLEALPPFLPGSGENLGFGIDRLAAIMILLISGVSTLVQVFSLRYLQGDPGYLRFFALVSLETGILLFLVASQNLLLIFIFWQVMSLGLALLMLHNPGRESSLRAAKKTFVIHRIGDGFFLVAILWAYQVFGTLDIGKMGAMIAGDPGLAGSGTLTGITLCLFAGCMAKSAQFPLNLWLPDTLEAPTPISALMHAGIVNVGGFFINRAAPLFAHSPLTMHFVFLTGFLTALFGSSIMLTQSEVKRKLAFSTMGQMGYMTMECGLGAFSLAIFHLIAHGLFKATLFLESGIGIGVARKEPLLPLRAPSEPQAPERFHFSRTIPAALTTLALPLIILLGAHQIAGVNLSREEGTVVFLFFSWVTVSQTTLSLTKARLFDSFSSAIPWTGLAVLFIYLYILAGHGFNDFLYPDRSERALFFASGGVGWSFFTPIVIFTALLIIAGWVVTILRETRGRMILPSWVLDQQEWLYLFFLNRGYLDLFLSRRVLDPVDRLLTLTGKILSGRRKSG